MEESFDSLKNKAQKHVNESDYGLFRNCLLKLSNLCRDQGRMDKALMYLMCCCYLDINGPNNTSGGSDDILEFYKKMKMWSEWEHYYFNPENHGYFAPGVISLLKQDLDNGLYTMDEYYNAFMENAIELCEDLNTLIAPTPAWKKLETELK